MAEGGPLREDHPHRLQSAGEGIEDEAKFFEGDGAEERLVTGFAKNDRGVTVSLREHDVTFGDLALDNATVPERETNGTLGGKPD